MLRRKKIKQVENLAANLRDKKEYVIYIKNLKQALNHKLVLKKVHKIIKFNQKAWLKLEIDMKAELRKKQRMIMKTKIFELMNNSVFGKP